MNKKALTLVMILPFMANAQDLMLRDMWYVAPMGTFGGNSKLQYSKTTQTVKSTPEQENKFSSFGIEQGFSYNPVENLEIGLSLGWDSTKQDTAGATDSDGITDPSLSARYRALLSDEHNLYLRPTLSLSPSLGKKKADNELNGHHGISVGIEIGQNLSPFEYSFGILVEHQTETKDDGGNEKAKTDVTLAVVGQYDFNEMVSGSLLLAVGILGDAGGTAAGSDTATFDPAFTIILGPDFQLNEKVALSVAGTYSTASGDYEYGAGGKDPLEANSVGVLADLSYNFN